MIDAEAAAQRNEYFLSNISGESLLCRRLRIGATDCQSMT